VVTVSRRIAAVLALTITTGVSIWAFGMLILLLPREMHDPAVRWGIAGVFGVVLGGYAALRIDRILAIRVAPQLVPEGGETRAEGERAVAARDISGTVLTGNVNEQLKTSPISAVSPGGVHRLKEKGPDECSAPARTIAAGDRSVAARDISGKVITGDTTER
jgi:hypothetical protein